MYRQDRVPDIIGFAEHAAEFQGVQQLCDLARLGLNLGGEIVVRLILPLGVGPEIFSGATELFPVINPLLFAGYLLFNQLRFLRVIPEVGVESLLV